MKEEFFKSKLNVSHKNLESLKTDLLRFLNKNQYVYCRSLKRKISLQKLPDAIVKRKSSARKRLQKFPVAINILKHSKLFTQNKNDLKQIQYEIKGLSHCGKIVTIHLREEVDSQKNRQIYFISCY